ncbi:hypothetical protein CRUP_030050 [Coryphaenoides rupestris]|nr:hypothetical protein CRUP_030050 [Coryphaenoides rupestris]
MDQDPILYTSVQHVESVVRTHHVENGEGGILDMDDPLSDLLEDKERLVAIFEEVPRGGASSPNGSISSYNGSASPAPSTDPLQYTSHFMPQDQIRAEIEVNEAVLKSSRSGSLAFVHQCKQKSSTPERPNPSIAPSRPPGPPRHLPEGSIPAITAACRDTPLLVRSSSDSALAPPLEVMAPPPHEDPRAPDAEWRGIQNRATFNQ